jgi:CelD/BcsL family acetyltransferase involved in cellulose biosynthesis
VTVVDVASPTVLAPAILDLDDPRWGAFVDQNEDATPFHHPSWARMLAETYRYRGFALGIAEGDGELIAGAPFLEVRSLSGRRRWISLPFTDECPLLANDSDAREALLTALADEPGRLRVPAVEIRAAVESFGWRVTADAVIHELELEPDPESVRKRFSRSQVIRNIARAEKEGVVVRHAVGEHDLDAFYRLHTRTRRRQGVPVQPRRFFELLWGRLVQPGLASILLADVPGAEAVAGALFLHTGATTIYKFGASDVESLRLRPNHAIFWTAIQAACARGDHCFDFGRTDLGNGGLRAFKRGWGGEERPLRYSALTPGAASGAEGIGSRALGAAIRRGPKWVCTVSGQALYRYAASR